MRVNIERSPGLRALWPAISLSILLTVAGCGYRLAGAGSLAGEGQTLAVPVFRNDSSLFRVEQTLTEAVRRELVSTTRYRVVPDEAGDLLLTGRVLDIRVAPTVFTDQGRAIVYTVAVAVSVRLVDTSDGSVLIDEDRLSFREPFEVSNDSVQFVPEDAAAMERLARQLASYLTTSMSRVIS